MTAPRRHQGLLRAGFLTAALLFASPAAARADEGSLGAPKAAPESALARVERHAVLVCFSFQRDLSAEATGVVPIDPDGATEVFRRWGMSMRVPGFLVNDRRTVLCSDVFLPAGALKSVEVKGRGGMVVPGKVTAFLPRGGGILVRTERELVEEPVAFGDGVVTASTPLLVGSVSEGVTGPQSWAEPLSGARKRSLDGSGFAWGAPEKPLSGLMGARFSRTIDLVMREDGTPLGFRFGATLDLAEKGWRGADVLHEVESAVPFASLPETAEKLRKTAPIYAVRLGYRPAGSEDEPLPGPWRGSSDPGEPDDDLVRFGIAVSPDLVVVPETLPESWIGRIERAAVEPEGRPRVAATFAGRVRGWGAFALRLTGATLPSLGAEAPRPPAAGAAFLAHVAGWRAGARRDHVEYHRSLGSPRGYGDVSRLATEEAVPSGAFLWTLAGQALGFSADLRPDDVDPTTGRAHREDDASRGVHAALFADFGSPGAIDARLDTSVMPRKADEGRRLPWLGVEVEPIRDAAVAAALGVSGPTRDGGRGLVVNVVHEESPAERAGLQPDDILLAARKVGEQGADPASSVDLRDTAGAPEWPDVSDVPRPWRPRANAIVRLLSSWEVGAKYEIEYWRAGEVRTAALVVETGPRDVSCALKARDEGTGLSIKELTYEVRRALRLAKDAPGVLVATVEEGSPAFQARILANEVIREVDGKPASDPESLVEALAKARAEGRENVRLVVLRLDRSRFVDLHVPRPPAEHASAGALPPSGDEAATPNAR